jgi:hypothetical protein
LKQKSRTATFGVASGAWNAIRAGSAHTTSSGVPVTATLPAPIYRHTICERLRLLQVVPGQRLRHPGR